MKDIKVRDSLAFVCSGGNFQMLNITNLNSIYEVGQLDITAAKEVVVSDSFAYVLTQYSPPLVYVIDITNVDEPYIRSMTPTASDFEIDMAVKDRFIYVTGYNWGFLTIIDARNPDGLVHYDQLLTSSAIEIRDTLMYLGKGGSLAIFSISNPIEPVFLDSAYCGVELGLREMIVQGNYAYSTNDSGLFVFDITNPHETFVVGHLCTREAASLATQGNILLMATYIGCNIIDIENSSIPNSISYYSTGDIPLDIVSREKYAFVASGDAGLSILDLSNPILPQRIGKLEFEKRSDVVELDNDTLYVGADSIIYVIDISIPDAPLQISTISTNKYSCDIYIENNLLYNLVPSEGMQIFDIANIDQPQFLGMNTYSGRRIFVRDSIAYLAGGSGGFVIVDVHNPNNPIELYRYMCWAYDLMINDTLAYVACPDSFFIFNISNFNQPNILSSISIPIDGFSVRMSKAKEYIYISSNNLITISISNPNDPKIVGLYSNNYGFEITTYKEYIYVCNTYYIAVFKNDLITHVGQIEEELAKSYYLYQNYPNPFNPTTIIPFYVLHSSFVSLKLYNIVGDELETIFEGWKTPGQYEYRLDARQYPTGIYYYRLKASDFEQTKKMILIR